MDVEEVKSRLIDLGYTEEINDASLYFAISKVENHIKNQANVSEVPAGLNNHAIDAVCAEYLGAMRAVGLLVGYDLEQGMNALKMGDTQINFVGATKSQLFDDFLNKLGIGLERELLCYRRVRW